MYCLYITLIRCIQMFNVHYVCQLMKLTAKTHLEMKDIHRGSNNGEWHEFSGIQWIKKFYRMNKAKSWKCFFFSNFRLVSLYHISFVFFLLSFGLKCWLCVCLCVYEWELVTKLIIHLSFNTLKSICIQIFISLIKSFLYEFKNNSRFKNGKSHCIIQAIST